MSVGAHLMVVPFDRTSRCLVKKHLSQDLYSKLKNCSTASGFTLDKAIRSGVINSDSSIGIYAGDAESYNVFAEIFDPVIEEYHGFVQGEKHVSDFSKVELLDPDPEKKYILSTRVRVARNIAQCIFGSHIELRERLLLEKTVVNALTGLCKPFSGEYFSFESTTDEEILFAKGDRFQAAAGLNTDFPKGRGIFYANDKRFRVWINEEDHLRLISQDSSGDLATVFNHLCLGITELQKNLVFVMDDRYGNLTTCPTNLGTSMRAGVHIRLPNLNGNSSLLNEIVKEYQLQVRGTGGEKTEVENCVFDISNERRLGLSEVSIIRGLHKGICAIIEAEKNCE
ncbi:MAG: protein-arginine kinase [Desulforhopalus sp.]|jgi:protein-arginine kinase